MTCPPLRLLAMVVLANATLDAGFSRRNRGGSVGEECYRDPEALTKSSIRLRVEFPGITTCPGDKAAKRRVPSFATALISCAFSEFLSFSFCKRRFMLPCFFVHLRPELATHEHALRDRPVRHGLPPTNRRPPAAASRRRCAAWRSDGGRLSIEARRSASIGPTADLMGEIDRSHSYARAAPNPTGAASSNPSGPAQRHSKVARRETRREIFLPAKP